MAGKTSKRGASFMRFLIFRIFRELRWNGSGPAVSQIRKI